MARRDPNVPLVAFTVDALKKSDDGPEPFVLRQDGQRVVKAATRALILSRETRAVKRDKLQRVLALAYVLETKKNSPTAGRALADTVTSFPEVAEIVGIETRALQMRGRRLAKFLGAAVIRRAPVIDRTAPVGSFKLASMLVTNTARQYR